jgi:hypothetical protein
VNTSTHPTFENSTAGTVLTSPSDGAAVDRATEAARRVIDALLRTDRANANLERVAEELNSIAEHLEEHAPAVAERLIDMWNGEGVTRHDPVTGPENALAPPVVLEGLADGSVQGTVTLTIPYQGPPGHVHGGVSALLLDHVLGVANAWGGKSGMTAQLSMRYHRPTPLFEPLTLTGKLIGVEGLFIDKTVPRPR